MSRCPDPDTLRRNIRLARTPEERMDAMMAVFEAKDDRRIPFHEAERLLDLSENQE